MTESSRLFFKRWYTVIILVAIVVFIVWVFLNFNFVYDRVQNKLFASDGEKEIKRLENLYKNDKYGGKTPEETFDLFISALKKGDIELASKYFVLNKQDDWRKSFNELKNKNLYEEMVSELEYAKLSHKKRIIDQNSVGFIYEVNSQGAEIIFGKYPSGVWKISVL